MYLINNCLSNRIYKPYRISRAYLSSWDYLCLLEMNNFKNNAKQTKNRTPQGPGTHESRGGGRVSSNCTAICQTPPSIERALSSPMSNEDSSLWIPIRITICIWSLKYYFTTEFCLKSASLHHNPSTIVYKLGIVRTAQTWWTYNLRYLHWKLYYMKLTMSSQLQSTFYVLTRNLEI